MNDSRKNGTGLVRIRGLGWLALGQFRPIEVHDPIAYQRSISEPAAPIRASPKCPCPDLAIDHRYLRLNDLSFHYLEFRDDFVCKPTQSANEFVIVQLWLKGSGEYRTGGTNFRCEPGQVVFLSTTEDYRQNIRRGAKQFAIWVPRAALNAVISSRLSGLKPTPPLQFDSVANVRNKLISSWVRCIKFAINDIDQNHASYASDYFRNALANMILTGLLLAQPHNYSYVFQTADNKPLPRYMLAADNYMCANLHKKLRLREIVDASGVSEGTLISAFKKYRNEAPMTYFRNLRLAQAHEELVRAADENASVTAIALRWGFEHHGRFSKLYKDAYGIYPYQTLKS